MKLPLPPSLCRAVAAALLCVALLGAPAPAAEIPAVGRACPAPVLVAQGWKWNKVWNVIEGNLNSRAALLRMGTVGMFIALFIIMRNKW
ncbi:MAG TPA: hypothetical protein VJ739_19620 [Gemmataceae bacterium]|nr:hypothetical protein [Gemmataceae bacterium]